MTFTLSVEYTNANEECSLPNLKKIVPWLGVRGDAQAAFDIGWRASTDDPESQVKPYVQCRDLFKIFKRADLEVVALRGVDLEIERGEFVAVVGASGSGKSTLLNILAGLDRPSAGQVTVGSKDLLNISSRELVLYRRLNVGFVWQATARNLVSYLTVQENIELPMAIAGVEGAKRHGQSLELLEALDMRDKANRLPQQLSGGEQQRVAISRAVVAKPDLLLADEPTGNVDPDIGRRLIRLFVELNRFGTTVMIATHDRGLVESTPARELRLVDGNLVQMPGRMTGAEG